MDVEPLHTIYMVEINNTIASTTMLLNQQSWLKRARFTKVARVIYVTTQWFDYIPLGYNKSHDFKKTVMSFHNYEKEVKRTTNKNPSFWQQKI